MVANIWRNLIFQCGGKMERVILERKFVAKGSIIIQEGDDAYSAYLIQSGGVRVFTKRNGQEHDLSQLGVGDICGEMALIEDNSRSATVQATEDCNLIVITRSAFEEKLKNSDPTIQAIVKMLITRMIESNDKRSEI